MNIEPALKRKRDPFFLFTAKFYLYTFLYPFRHISLTANVHGANKYITLVCTFGKSWTEIIQTRYIASKIAPLYLMLHVYKVCINK